MCSTAGSCSRCTSGARADDRRAARRRWATPTSAITLDLAGRERVVEGRWQPTSSRARSPRSARARRSCCRPTPSTASCASPRRSEPLRAALRAQGPRGAAADCALVAASVDALLELRARAARRDGTIVERAPARAVHARAPEPRAALPLADRRAPRHDRRARRRRSPAQPQRVARRGRLRRSRRARTLPAGRTRRRSTTCPRGSARAAGPSSTSGALPGVASTVIDFTGAEPRVLREGAAPAAEAIARVRRRVVPLSRVAIRGRWRSRSRRSSS